MSNPGPVTDIDPASGASHFAKVHQSAQISGLGAAETTIACDTTDFDVSGCITGGKYVCPATGYYLACAELKGSANFYAALIRVNDVTKARGTGAVDTTGGAANVGSSVSAILKCNTGDVIALGIFPTGANTPLPASGGEFHNFLTVCQIG